MSHDSRGLSNHRQLQRSFNRLLMLTKTLKLALLTICERNQTVTCECTSQWTINVKIISVSYNGNIQTIMNITIECIHYISRYRTVSKYQSLEINIWLKVNCTTNRWLYITHCIDLSCLILYWQSIIKNLHHNLAHDGSCNILFTTCQCAFQIRGLYH